MSAVKARLLIALIRGAAALVRRVPPVAVGPLCGVVGTVWFLLAGARRQAVAFNLRRILGREPTREQVRAVFRHGVLNYWDTLAIPQRSPEEILTMVDVQGWDHLDAALERGKGVILAGAHLSSVAFAGQVVAARGHPVVGVVEPVDPPRLFDAVNSLRQTRGVRLLPAGPSAARELLQALRRNEVLGLVTDRDVLGTGIPVEFFGATTSFPDGAAALSIRTGAPILPAVAIRTGSGRFTGYIDAPVPHPATGDSREDVRQLTQAVARRLEYHISRHPEQWTVFQKRWPDREEPGHGRR